MAAGLEVYKMNASWFAEGLWKPRNHSMRDILAPRYRKAFGKLLRTHGHPLDLVDVLLDDVAYGLKRRGRPKVAFAPAIYVNALERFAWAMGTPLTNAAFYPCPLEFLSEIDAILAARGVPANVRLARMVLDGVGIALPPADGPPLVGRITSADLAAAGPSIAVLDTSGPHEAPLKAIQSWCSAVAGTSDGIVAFYQ